MNRGRRGYPKWLIRFPLLAVALTVFIFAEWHLLQGQEPSYLLFIDAAIVGTVYAIPAYLVFLVLLVACSAILRSIFKGSTNYPHNCPNCGQTIWRGQNDRFLKCYRCGWKVGYPLLRWLRWTDISSRLRRADVKVATMVLFIGVTVLVFGFGVETIDDELDGDAGVFETSFNATLFEEVDYKEEVDTDKVEVMVFDGVNEERQERPYQPFRWNDRAAEAAKAHAEDMAERGYFSHTSLDGETQMQRYSFCEGGENLAQTYYKERIVTESGTKYISSEEELADAIVNQWMNSDPHRERGIYGEWWSSAGVGIAITEDGTVYAAMGFCQ